MITVKFDMKKYEVSINGHANYDEAGKDIVCAAASILFYTLCENLGQMSEMLRKDSLKSRFKSGNGKVSCKPLKAFEPNITLVYWTIFNGFNLLAEGYPDYIEIKTYE